ncbi:MAG TPA: four helix bundle protein [Terriglobales bacterium]|nr:four helix bundle protein [Terriglobales bacterium]
MADKIDLRDRTRDFALRIMRLCKALPKTAEGGVIKRQLLRSGTSIGANYSAARRGRSHAGFVAKMGIALEEADETVCWLELIVHAQLLPAKQLELLLDEANQVVAILVASLRTARSATSAI